MPTPEDLQRVLAIAKSRRELDFFFEQLKSPDWIPILERERMFENPAAPTREKDGISFPGWAPSRYLARVAGEAPDAVAAVLFRIRTSENPRVWSDILEALVAMPAPYALPFLADLTAWIHSPYQLGQDDRAAQIGRRLLGEGFVREALTVLSSLSALVAPDGWPDGSAWAPLQNWDYTRLVPPLAQALVPASPDAGPALAREFLRGFEAGEAESAYTSIWRPAIEDHEQNWGHDRTVNGLVNATRDTFLARLQAHPDELRAAVEGLLEMQAGILKRMGIYLLVELGNHDRDLVAAVLTNKLFFDDPEFNHEFHRLAEARFVLLTEAERERYFALVDETTLERSQGHPDQEGQVRGDGWARVRLQPVANFLAGERAARYRAISERWGEDEHPGFLSWHSSWWGPNSPLSTADLGRFTIVELADYLRSWTAPDAFGPAPSREGLARELQTAAASDPAHYAPLANYLADLPPLYTSWFLLGMREALKGEIDFGLHDIVRLCWIAVERSRDVEPDAAGFRDDTWRSTRIEVARFLEDALERKRLESDPDSSVWATIRLLLEDSDPTPTSEERYGPPNQDPLTYSLNSTRGQAVHAAIAYVWWSWSRADDKDGWNLASDLPETVRALEAHLSAADDPSLAIGAAFGWGIPWLIAVDAGWVREKAGVLFGDFSTDRNRAAWDAFLMRARPGRIVFEPLKDFYLRYARLLSRTRKAPNARMAMTDPVARYLDHLVVLDLHGALPRRRGPLEAILGTGRSSPRTWLIAALVEAAGRIAHNSGPLDHEVDEAFRSLWLRIRAVVQARNNAAERASLGFFSWWFASSLRSEWTLPEINELLGRKTALEADFLVLPRLAELASDRISEVLLALGRLLPASDQSWAIRAHEGELEKILRLGIEAPSIVDQERARAIVNRLGMLGMFRLRNLLSTSPVDPATVS